MLAAAVSLIFGLATPSTAQPAGAIIKPLLRTTLSGDPTKDVIIASAEFPAGSTTGRHIHPGDEYATLLEGELEILVDGKPPLRVKAGESYHNARNVIHETKSVGKVPARLVSTFVIDKGASLSQPVTDP